MFLFLLFPVALFAQGETLPPVDTWFVSLGLTAAAAVALAALLNTLLKTTGFFKQLVAWVVAVALVGISNLLGVGFAADFTLLYTAIYGVAVGLVANGIFDIEFVKALLRLFKIEK